MQSFSEPPINMTTKPDSVRPVTFADVAMRMANDGPIYAIIGLVGAMAIAGKATATETLITGLAGLLARSWPRAVQVAGKAGAMLLVVGAAGAAFASVHACYSP